MLNHLKLKSSGHYDHFYIKDKNIAYNWQQFNNGLLRGEQMTEELTAQQRANKKWNERNRKHRNYLTKRSTSRGFIRNNATKEDLLELQKLIQKNLKKFKKKC